ncbi:MAG TPA: GDSL-type esterase/lipase family protein [Kofleriaceae bacterium]|jgi:lysophospholipase L1-like esterase|nr:GDSL-type esterase/lipase family protein [Kofleriaceae bacterium]
MSTERFDRTFVALGSFAAVVCGTLLIREHGIRAITDRFTPDPNTEADTAPPPIGGPSFVRAPEPQDEALDEAPPLPPKPVFGGGSAGVNVPKPKQPIEDTCVDPLGATTGCKRFAMDGLYAELAATEAGTAKVPTRVSYYGDSVSATDQIPGRVRRRLQDVFGDGGPGFVFAASPHRFNHNLAVDQIDRGWNAYGVSTVNIADGMYGPGGSTAEAHGDGTIKITPKTPSGKVAHVDVYYLSQPKGGTADVLVDGQVKTSLDTAADDKKAGWSAIDLDDAAHKVEVKVTKGKVRLFGLTLERAPGVVVDNMAIISATAKNEGLNEPTHWKEQLAHRGADLVILMLGTNEAEWLSPGQRSMADYQQVWESLLAPIRAARPNAACLVVSPLDQAEVKDDDTLASRPVMPHMIEAQRRAAKAQGCAFYDTYTWQGGKGAAIKWNRRGLVGSDFQHLSEKGTAMVADGLTDAILAGYAEYKSR